MSEGTTRVEAMYLAEQMKYSLIVLASLPLLAAYPFVQRYCVKGVMIGAIKG
jgi:putative aldouronate transport system permease protein